MKAKAISFPFPPLLLLRVAVDAVASVVLVAAAVAVVLLLFLDKYMVRVYCIRTSLFVVSVLRHDVFKFDDVPLLFRENFVCTVTLCV